MTIQVRDTRKKDRIACHQALIRAVDEVQSIVRDRRQQRRGQQRDLHGIARPGRQRQRQRKMTLRVGQCICQADDLRAAGIDDGVVKLTGQQFPCDMSRAACRDDDSVAIHIGRPAIDDRIAGLVSRVSTGRKRERIGRDGGGQSCSGRLSGWCATKFNRRRARDGDGMPLECVQCRGRQGKRIRIA